MKIRLEDEVLRATALEPQSKGWTARSTDGKRLTWLMHDGSTAYLTAYTIDRESRAPVYELPLQLRRLDLRSGRWLPGMTLTESRTPGQIVALLPGENQLAVLAAQFKTGSDDPENPLDEPEIASFRVALFETSTARCLWSQALPTAGTRSGPGVFLWAARAPDYAVDETRYLSWMGNALVVNTGPLDDITCLESSTGMVRWRTERIWEFTRGFTGPSVWAHHLGRFGTHSGDRDEGTIESRRKMFNERFTCAIIGGPLVLPFPAGPVPDPRSKARDYRIFVAVSRAAVSEWEGFLAECLVYELNEEGEPIAVANLPRMVQGSQAVVHEKGIAWNCQDRGVLRLIPSLHGRSSYSGPGSPNLLVNLAWYRQLPSSVPHAWLKSDPAGDPCAFIAGHLIRPAGGGYNTQEREGIYRFPLVLMDSATGETRPLTLAVPYGGKIARPTTNMRQLIGADGKPRIETLGPWVLGVTRLESRGTRLIVTMGQETDVTRLEFDLATVIRSPAAKR